MEENKKSVYGVLSAINVSEYTEKKNGLTYLSWAWAWAKVKENFPQATYKIYERENGCIYFDDGRTAWVKTGVEIEGLEYIEYLPIMDFKNQSIPLEKITSFDVNKAIQRSLTKAVARHGLGLYVYAGEDLPEEEKKETLNKYDLDIANAKTPENLTTILIAIIRDENTKFDVKQDIKKKLYNKAKELNCVFDKELKMFTDAHGVEQKENK